MATVVKSSMAVYAFDCLIAKLKGKESPPVPADFPHESYPLFVTWKTSANDHLRGCIGCFDDLELGAGIRDYALTAALRDSRFKPVQLNEVAGLSVTVSLLTQFEPCQHAFDWTLEKHGIRILFHVLGRRYSGTYLPGVALEQGWSQEETLESLARKAGYRGQVDRGFLNSMQVTRYQSEKTTLDYENYQSF